ncbi:hypothetical protein [Sandarakinorhabdus sp.]|uniref:hypothetical protein n=1 Tax=Sandarakinorhabdus sp. TaxID=1916663 RepID=UPI003566C870
MTLLPFHQRDEAPNPRTAVHRSIAPPPPHFPPPPNPAAWSRHQPHRPAQSGWATAAILAALLSLSGVYIWTLHASPYATSAIASQETAR